MTTETTPKPDVMPEPEDDREERPAPPAQQADDSGGDDQPVTKTEKPDAPEDPRAAIARRYQENRKREKEAKAEQATAPRDDDSHDQDTVVDPAPEPEQPKAKDEPDPQDIDVVLIVDGKQVKKSLSEVRALAQVGLAGDNRLEEAKRLLREAQAMRAPPPPPEHQPGDVGSDSQRQDQSRGRGEPEHQPGKPLDPAKLKAIVERIQVGDADDGSQALQELVDEISGGRQMDSDQIGTIVQDHLVKTQTQNEISSALNKFAAEWPEIAQDELLADAGKTVLRNELIADLKSVGLSDELIRPIRHDPAALAEAQRKLRMQGHKMRSYDQLLSAVGQTMSTRFGIKPAAAAAPRSQQQPPAPQTPAPNAERLARKQAAPQQPRVAGVRQAVQQAPQPKTKRQVVEEMRAARGFR